MSEEYIKELEEIDNRHKKKIDAINEYYDKRSYDRKSEIFQSEVENIFVYIVFAISLICVVVW